MDIDLIKQNYSERSLESLRTFLDDLGSLREDAVQALRDEFASREDIESVQIIDVFTGSEKQTFTEEDARRYIQEELANGQSLQVIKLDLMDRGMNIFDILDNDAEKELDAIEYLTHLKANGVNSNELHEYLHKEFEVEEGKEGEVLKAIKRKGNINIVLGWFFLLGGFLLLFAQLYLGRIPITSCIFIVLGIWRISRGMILRN